jgi:hypothetical protein
MTNRVCELLHGSVPLGFQAAGDQPVVGVDGPVAALGLGGVVAGLLDLALVLGQRGVVAVFELSGGGQAGLHRGRGKRGQERLGDGGIDGLPSVHVPGTADESLAGQQVRGSRLRSGRPRGFWASAGGRAEVAVDLAGDVTLQAADDLRLGLSFGRAALGVGAGGRVRAHRVNTIRHRAWLAWRSPPGLRR